MRQRGTSLSTIPPGLFHTPFSEPVPEIEHALELPWSSVTDFVELKIQHRCEDHWYMVIEVQQECRVDNLSKGIHSFLHGMPISVPGCWLDNRMYTTEFRTAISIVANNDLKDQICK